MKAGAKGVMGSALRSFPSSSSRAFRLSSGLALLPWSVLPTKPVKEAITSTWVSGTSSLLSAIPWSLAIAVGLSYIS